MEHLEKIEPLSIDFETLDLELTRKFNVLTEKYDEIKSELKDLIINLLYNNKDLESRLEYLKNNL